jgi:hypothetical protein
MLNSVIFPHQQMGHRKQYQSSSSSDPAVANSPHTGANILS